MVKYNLFLDDVREPNGSWMSYMRRLISYELYEWKVVRNYDEFKQCIDTKGIPQFISYDHDLAESHYDQSMYGSVEEYESKISDSQEKTGLECAKYLISKLDGEPHPPYIVHSQNPVGKIRIEKCIIDHNNNVRQQII